MKIIITESQYIRVFINEEEVKKIPNKTPSWWMNIVDWVIPGAPVEDGYKIYNEFADIVNKRIDYNKKEGLPLDQMTKEEIKYRENVAKKTPTVGKGYYGIGDLFDVIDDMSKGIDVEKKYKDRHINLSKKFGTEHGIVQVECREELKRMWLGIATTGSESGCWHVSKFKPSKSTNPDAIYYQPADIPSLSPEQFNGLYGFINNTATGGKFPGGNDKLVYRQVVKDKGKKIDPTFYRKYFTGLLGNYKLSTGSDSKGKFISIYDYWDLAPETLKDYGIDLNQFSPEVPEIYYKIYEP